MNPKEKILTTAEKLFLRYGLRSVTMDDLARKLGISKKTLYQYVENKMDLVQKIMMAHVEEEKALVEQARATSQDAVEEMFKVARHVIRELRELTPTFMYDLQKYYGNLWLLLQKTHLEYGQVLIQQNIERGIAEGVYRSDVDAEILSKIYVKSTFALVDEEVFPLKKYNKEALFVEFIKYHIHGLATSKGLENYERLLDEMHSERKALNTTAD